MHLIRSLLLLAAQPLAVLCVDPRLQANSEHVTGGRVNGLQWSKQMLEWLTPTWSLDDTVNNQVVPYQSKTPLLPGQAQKRAILRKRQNATDASSVATATTPLSDETSTTTPTELDTPTNPSAPTTPTAPSPPSPTPPTTVAPPTQAPPPTTAASSETPSPPPVGDSPSPSSSQENPVTSLAPVPAPSSTGQNVPSSTGENVPSSTGENVPSSTGEDVPTSTNGQNTAPVPAPTNDNAAAPDTTQAPGTPTSITGEIDVVTTDNEGQPITLSDVSYGEVLTTTGRDGRSSTTTFTPTGRVSRVVFRTTTLPNGQPSTITSITVVEIATSATVNGPAATSVDASLQTGAAPPALAHGRVAAVAGGLLGLAQVLNWNF